MNAKLNIRINEDLRIQSIAIIYFYYPADFLFEVIIKWVTHRNI
jgi:hypothetical protein